MLFLVVRAQLQGYIAIENFLVGAVQDRKLDFFALMKAAGSDETERLNVAREAYRLLLRPGLVMWREPEMETAVTV